VYDVTDESSFNSILVRKLVFRIFAYTPTKTGISHISSKLKLFSFIAEEILIRPFLFHQSGIATDPVSLIYVHKFFGTVVW
jgi:hypothetical protein